MSKLQYFLPQLSDTLLLPQILLKDDHIVKSNKSFDNDNGQISLPKTFVTRKGALLLFTPSEELLTVEKEQKPVDVYEDGLTLGTIGNLANSVLQFGKKVWYSYRPREPRELFT